MGTHVLSLLKNYGYITRIKTTSPLLSNSTNIWFTFDEWVPCSVLTSFSLNQIAGTSYNGNITVTINNNNALARSGVTNFPIQFILPVTNGKGTIYFNDNVLLKNEYNQPFIYINLSVPSSAQFSVSTVFQIKVEGYITYVNDYEFNNDSYHYNHVLYQRVLRATSNSPSALTYDLSSQARQAFNYGDLEFVAFDTPNAYLYIGNANIFNNIIFYVNENYKQAPNSVVNCEAWTGSSWTSVTGLLNNTSSAQVGYNSAFEFSGLITLPTIPNWTSIILPNDPINFLGNQLAKGTYGYMSATLFNPPRYWIRFNMPSINPNNPLKLTGITIV